MKRNHIIDAIIDSGLIEPGMAVVIGVSGGPDSLCLLHALNTIRDAYDLTLVPVHINHKLRPEADRECGNVMRMCERMDLECQVFESSCRELAEELGVSVEAAGRQIRYEVFDDVADELIDMGIPDDKVVIAVAHNADDQVETVLFRLIRGTGPHGLAGIPYSRLSEGGNLIVRPLLGVERRDIEAYIKENRLRPNIDKSNDDNKYTRNRIRNELIPYLEENFNPRVRENIRRYAMLASLDDTFLCEAALADYLDNSTIDADSGSLVLDISELRCNPPQINSRVVSTAMELLGLREAITFENVMAVTELIYSGNPSGGVDLPFGIRAARDYDRLLFSTGQEIIKADATLEIYPRVIPVREFSPSYDSAYAAFDFDKFNAEHPGRLGDIILRTRREGDYLPMKEGRKKIQDLLVDSKVKKNARESILMVCIDNEVLWILPSEYFSGEREKSKGRFSPKFHIDDTTQRVLFIELESSI